MKWLLNLLDKNCPNQHLEPALFAEIQISRQIIIMDLRQILAVVCIIQLSHASFTKLKDVVPYIHRRDYLKELEKNNFYCTYPSQRMWLVKLSFE